MEGVDSDSDDSDSDDSDSDDSDSDYSDSDYSDWDYSDSDDLDTDSDDSDSGLESRRSDGKQTRRLRKAADSEKLPTRTSYRLGQATD
jgi:hypothetical protein